MSRWTSWWPTRCSIVLPLALWNYIPKLLQKNGSIDDWWPFKRCSHIINPSRSCANLNYSEPGDIVAHAVTMVKTHGTANYTTCCVLSSSFTDPYFSQFLGTSDGRWVFGFFESADTTLSQKYAHYHVLAHAPEISNNKLFLEAWNHDAHKKHPHLWTRIVNHPRVGPFWSVQEFVDYWTSLNHTTLTLQYSIKEFWYVKTSLEVNLSV